MIMMTLEVLLRLITDVAVDNLLICAITEPCYDWGC